MILKKALVVRRWISSKKGAEMAKIQYSTPGVTGTEETTICGKGVAALEQGKEYENLKLVVGFAFVE